MNNENEAYNQAIPFLQIYPDFDLNKLPNWIRKNIDVVRVSGNKFKSLITPDGRRYNLDNQLNHLSGQEWTYFINSVFITKYLTKGKESYAHNIRKIHPSPKPPQLMRDIINFFTKENEIVFDYFMGVGGTLLGAALCNRRAVGIDLNQKFIDVYEEAASSLNLKIYPTYCDEALNFFSDKKKVDDALGKEKISLVLIDPPYGNMMSKKKTGADISIYGKNATPFTDSDKDLGNMSKSDFLLTLKESVKLVLPYIKVKGHVVVFIKDLQPKYKDLNMLHYDIAKSINEIDELNYKGMKIWADETAKLYPYGYPFSFVANQIHQYILIFRKEK